jgi:prophage antirepressor-like protein
MFSKIKWSNEKWQGNRIMDNLILFEQRQVRRVWSEADQKWYFAIVDVVGVLTESVDSGAYWRKLKERLKKEGNETVTNCHAFKMTAADGKQRITDVADAEQLLRLIQSVPSPKAEPFKRWLAKVGGDPGRGSGVVLPSIVKSF